MFVHASTLYCLSSASGSVSIRASDQDPGTSSLIHHIMLLPVLKNWYIHEELGTWPGNGLTVDVFAHRGCQLIFCHQLLHSSNTIIIQNYIVQLKTQLDHCTEDMTILHRLMYFSKTTKEYELQL